MNKKITKKFLEDKYDELYKKASELHDKFNPCGVKTSGKRSCIAGRNEKNYCKENLRESFCCVGCTHLGEKGCKVQALRCKLWFCGCIYEEGVLDPEAKKEMDEILKEAWEYGFLVFRGTREDNLYEAFYKFGLLRKVVF